MRSRFNKEFLFVFILLNELFIFPVYTNECELTSDDPIQFTKSQFFRSRQFCDPTFFLTADTRPIVVTGRLLDYKTDCQQSINNANIEIIHLRSNIHSICQELHHPNPHGYFNFTTTMKIPFTEQILLRVIAFGYKTILKQIPLSLSPLKSNAIRII